LDLSRFLVIFLKRGTCGFLWILTTLVIPTYFLTDWDWKIAVPILDDFECLAVLGGSIILPFFNFSASFCILRTIHLSLWD
jgi:hypothetical protein